MTPIDDDIWTATSAATGNWSAVSSPSGSWSAVNAATAGTYTPQHPAWPYLQAESGDWLQAEDGEALEVEH
jgi:hypothetical protein